MFFKPKPKSIPDAREQAQARAEAAQQAAQQAANEARRVESLGHRIDGLKEKLTVLDRKIEFCKTEAERDGVEPIIEAMAAELPNLPEHLDVYKRARIQDGLHKAATASFWQRAHARALEIQQAARDEVSREIEELERQYEPAEKRAQAAAKAARKAKG